MKQQIARFSWSHLRGTEYPIVAERVFTIVEKHNPVALHIEKRWLDAVAYRPQVEQIKVQIRANKKSLEIDEADDVRDTDINALHGIGKILVNLTIPELRTYGTLIEALFAKHGTDIAHDSYMSETRRLNEFCADVEASDEVKNALTKLCLMPLYNEMKAANEKVEHLTRERTLEEAGKATIDVQAVRKGCSTAIVNLLDAIEYSAEVYTDVDYTALIAELNRTTSEIRTQLNARAARRKAGEAVENEPPIEVK